MKKFDYQEEVTKITFSKEQEIVEYSLYQERNFKGGKHVITKSEKTDFDGYSTDELIFDEDVLPLVLSKRKQRFENRGTGDIFSVYHLDVWDRYRMPEEVKQERLRRHNLRMTHLRGEIKDVRAHILRAPEKEEGINDKQTRRLRSRPRR